MKLPRFPLKGSCRCGQVKIAISAAPLMTAACHCTGCQTMSSSAFSLTAIIPSDAFAVIAGDTVIGGLRGPELHHHFCPSCMTWMFTRHESFHDLVNVRPTMLEHSSWFSPFIETMTKERLPWARTPARYQFESFPPMEEFQSLMQEFASDITTQPEQT
jgi:hypothetical protein